MTDTPAPTGRPKSVDGAFYCWVVGSILVAAVGLLMISQGVTELKIVGGMLAVVGLAQAYLAGRARKGDIRFGRAAVALAMVTVVFVALVLLVVRIHLVVVAIIGVAVILLIVGSSLNRRPSSVQWYNPEGSR